MRPHSTHRPEPAEGKIEKGQRERIIIIIISHSELNEI